MLVSWYVEVIRFMWCFFGGSFFTIVHVFSQILVVLLILSLYKRMLIFRCFCRFHEFIYFVDSPLYCVLADICWKLSFPKIGKCDADVCDFMNLIKFMYFCCFSESMYFQILDSIGCWLIFEDCSHLQSRFPPFCTGPWKAWWLIIARWSCIIHFGIQAIASSTTDGQCVVSYTNNNTQEINETLEFEFFAFARQKSWKTQCGTNAIIYARCQWNRWFMELCFRVFRRSFFFSKSWHTTRFVLN